MHTSVMDFADEMVGQHALASEPVLEIGGMDVNGTVRSLFRGPYLSTDMRPGDGVDEVADAHDLSRYYGTAPVVVCTEMLEHDSAPWITITEARKIPPGAGWLLLTCRGYDERGCMPVHDFPGDYWRFSVGGVRELLTWAGWEVVEARKDPQLWGVLALARCS